MKRYLDTEWRRIDKSGWYMYSRSGRGLSFKPKKEKYGTQYSQSIILTRQLERENNRI